MTDRPPHLNKPGWRHEPEPQPEMLWKPLPWYRRLNAGDWWFVAICVFGAVAAVVLVVTGP